MQPSFLEIPDIPMEMIMNNLDYLSIRSVRKTCWDLRNFIDDMKPGIYMKRIEINETSDTAVKLAINGPLCRKFIPESLPANTYIDLTYEKHENGCRISNKTSEGSKIKIVENLNFLDAVFHDFKVALNTQKSIFKRVTAIGNTFFEKFAEMAKSQKPFATESIEIHTDSPQHARQIMRCADPKYLKEIYTRKTIKSIGINPREHVVIIEAVKLESSENIQNLFHFSIYSILLEHPRVKMIQAVKENFLQFHEYNKHLVVISNLGKNLFIDTFGVAFQPPGVKDEIWFFSVPENKEKVLKACKSVVKLEFFFIEKCEVPEGYVILD
ncbi:hypothetical protein GCK72_021367 [Caenorhabditis remanei]|uniref:F-box domain-containing protein n=1 Tax=Caenorhabditis remanei TaxID=31234 RepID=A0A6A5GJD2_CAERE|nr:hypothetical protein GCK72_021367 [Caenorhabditis remanei]KAF1754803.1 hypothetical protein GCK72_021367 [Caenorhabditis remanei]